MDDEALLAALGAAADAVSAALRRLSDWGPAGTRPGQYRSDLVADEAAVAVLTAAGLGVLSEESGRSDDDCDVLVVLDPVDGSTNAAQGIPWFATSMCAVDHEGPRVAMVADQARGVRFHAVRGGGARRDGLVIKPSACRSLRDAILALSGWPGRHLGWRQYRVLGAAALDLCAVAEGVVDAYLECDGGGRRDPGAAPSPGPLPLARAGHGAGEPAQRGLGEKELTPIARHVRIAPSGDRSRTPERSTECA